MAVAVVQSGLASRFSSDSETTAREFYFFNLFRVLEACIIVTLMFSPYALAWVEIAHPELGRGTALFYLLFAVLTLAFATREARYLRFWADTSLVVDIVVCAVAMFSIHRQFISIALLLLVNLGGAATLLPRQTSFFFAALATFGVFSQCILGNLFNQDEREIIEAGICGLAYFSVTALCLFLGRRMRDSEALASRRGSDLRNLAQINELIIRRMKTGVLVVDGGNIVHRWNESAAALIGNPTDRHNDLGRIAPELSRRLYHWRTQRKTDNSPIAFAAGAPEVIPRFTRMTSNDDENVLIFLDDTSLVSRRAEQLTLASMGRLAGSIAHEIRNPLAAISYSAQLLAESESMDQSDRRMIEIIRNHAGRVNEIVENILHLARRERSMPECIELTAWTERFITEFKTTIDIGANSLTSKPQKSRVDTLVDPKPAASGRLESRAKRAALWPRTGRTGKSEPDRATVERQRFADARRGRSRPRHSEQGRSADFRAFFHDARTRHRPWPVSGSRDVRSQSGLARLSSAGGWRQLFPHHLRPAADLLLFMSPCRRAHATRLYPNRFCR
ncbi:MAG: two-component sensor histidine kinase [Proteobacteria bacterium]|nr:two-component sensor histidine kinase [Pseudomonadota bacterium]